MPHVDKPICNLKKVRQSRGITQEVLGKKLGIRSASVAMLENNKRGASVALVIRLMDVLCCKFEDLYPTEQVRNYPVQKLEDGAEQVIIL